MTHPRIEAVDKETADLRDRFAMLRADRRQALGELVQADFPDKAQNPHALIEGHWACPDPEDESPKTPQSPTGKCIYVVGPNDETCIYCGWPAERK